MIQLVRFFYQDDLAEIGLDDIVSSKPICYWIKFKMKVKKIENKSVKATIILTVCLSILTLPISSFAKEEGPFILIENNPELDQYWKVDEGPFATFNLCKNFAMRVKDGRLGSPSNALVYQRKNFRYYCVTEAELSDYSLKN